MLEVTYSENFTGSKIMDFHLNFNGAKKVLNKHKRCRLDVYLIHAIASQKDDLVCPEEVAECLELTEERVSSVLDRSIYFKRTRGGFVKKNNRETYRDSLVCVDCVEC